MKLTADGLTASGILEPLVSGLNMLNKVDLISDQGFITAESGNKYRSPDTGLINEILNKNLDMYCLKIDQGFDTLLVIPGIVGHYALVKALVKVASDRGFSVKDDLEEYLFMAYHRGVSRLNRNEFYSEQPCPGYQVILVRSGDSHLPDRRHQIERAGSERSDFGAGLDAHTHRSGLGRGRFFMEKPLTVDGTIVYYIESILRTNLVPDECTIHGGTKVFCSWNTVTVANSSKLLTPVMFSNLLEGLIHLTTVKDNAPHDNITVRSCVPIIHRY